MFWLSHHPPDELHRTYRVRGVRLCARCSGMYPALAATLAVLFGFRAPLGWSGDVALVLALTAPALADWSVGCFAPSWGPRGLRTWTGASLGVALGCSLFVHVQRPLPQTLLAQAALVTAVGLPVILLSRRARKLR